MRRYILRRLFWLIPTVSGVLLLTFLLFNCLAGDISYEYAGRAADEKSLQDVRRRLGLDKPLVFAFDSQFVGHFKKAVTFNFGLSRDGERINLILAQRAGCTLALTVPILAGTILISIAVALLMAYFRNGIFDNIIMLLCAACVSIPFISFVLFGQFILAYKMKLFAVYFWPDLSMVQYLFLPIIIGISAGLGPNIRFFYSCFLGEMNRDYVRTARAKGLSEAKVLFKHVLKNSMVSVITRVVSSIPFLFLGSVLLERVFGIPGIGSLVADSLAAGDYGILNAVVFIAAILVVVFTLIADICYVLVDPRIALEN
jgi:peptide/nickel transport system permease protein